MARGILYIMKTSIKGLFKIGKTNINNFENRIYGLESDGYKNVTGLKLAFAIEVNDFDEKETLLHKVFSKSQVGTSELFAVDFDLAKKLLSSFEGKIIYSENNKEENNSRKSQTKSKSRDIGCIPDGEYHPESKTYHPATLVKKDNHLILKKGSLISPLHKTMINAKRNQEQNAVKKRNNLPINEITHRLEEDVQINSPSLAGFFVSGKGSNNG